MTQMPRFLQAIGLRSLTVLAAVTSGEGMPIMSRHAQGQRPLSRFATENIEEEVIVPTATSPLHGDALLAGMLLEE